MLGIKQRLAERSAAVNKIPSYYRLNTTSQVLGAIDGLGFASAHFYYYPCLQWDVSFPRLLRFAPRLFDFVLGARVPRYALVLAYRLEVAHD